MQPSGDLEINLDNSEIPDRVPARSQKTIFVNGFVDNRLHNQSLLAIIHDLLPTYYITSNPTSMESGTRSHLREMLSAAEATLFLMNEFTLKDKRCLLALQCAWDLMVPIIMLRHPRMKLVINQIKPNHRKVRSHSAGPAESLDMFLLQEILVEAYKHSIIYDPFHHQAGIKQIRARLHILLDQLLSRNQEPHRLKLPPINTYAMRSTSSTPPNSSNQRSKSIGGKLEGKKSNCKPKSNLQAAPERRSASVQLVKTRNDSSSTSLGGRSSSGTLDDNHLYTQTQYLVFPVKDKSHKPKLIKFPTDITEDGNNDKVELDSIWGSETSLEEEFNLASEIQGNLEVISPPHSPAPYLGALE